MREKIAKLEVVKEETMENSVEVVETAPVKKTWSLKKKLALGAAALLGLGIGVFALTHKNKSDEVDEDAEDFDDVVDDVDEDEAEEPESTEVQTTEV